MKNIIKKFCAIFAALSITVSVVGTTCNAAYAYDDEVEIILPMWEDEDEMDNDSIRD